VCQAAAVVNVDVHAHVLPRSALDAYTFQRPWHGFRVSRTDSGHVLLQSEARAIRLESSTFYWDPGAARVERMDSWGLDVQVLSVSPVMLGYDRPVEQAIGLCSSINEDIAQMVEEWPGRFAGLATLPLQSPEHAVKELVRAMEELGAVGAQVGTHVNGVNWDSVELFPVLEAAESTGALLFVHPADVRMQTMLPGYHLKNTLGNPTETAVAIASLIYGGALDRFPSLRVCFAHGGGVAPWLAGRMDHAGRVRDDARLPSGRSFGDCLSSLYFDSVTHSPRALTHLVDAVGAGHVLLGTDFPADMAQTRTVEWFKRIDSCDDATARAILGDNAVDLLGLEARKR
jgi:aminocarboxymuconate-semialdehyde decarboxylase